MTEQEEQQPQVINPNILKIGDLTLNSPFCSMEELIAFSKAILTDPDLKAYLEYFVNKKSVTGGGYLG